MGSNLTNRLPGIHSQGCWSYQDIFLRWCFALAIPLCHDPSCGHHNSTPNHLHGAKVNFDVESDSHLREPLPDFNSSLLHYWWDDYDSWSNRLRFVHYRHHLAFSIESERRRKQRIFRRAYWYSSLLVSGFSRKFKHTCTALNVVTKLACWCLRRCTDRLCLRLSSQSTSSFRICYCR